MHINLGISIVICTYNGEKRLPEVLRHLLRLRVHEYIPWEVIVIDNASTDSTAQVVKQVWEEGQPGCILLHQPQQGLTYAREMALEKAKYEFILFCDDDNWLSEDYLNVVFDLMTRHPEIGALGGQGELVYEETPPYWVLNFPKFAGGKQAKRSGRVPANAVYGAGFVLRKSAYDKLLANGFQPLLTDRVATNLSSGGDFELCYGLALAGYEVWYDERLRFKHFIPKGRTSWEYYIKLFDEGSECFEVLVPYQIITGYKCSTMPAFWLRLVQRFFKHLKSFLAVAVIRLLLPSRSAAGKMFLLKYLSHKARMVSFRRHKTMQAHFKNLVRFQEQLQKNRQPAAAQVAFDTATELASSRQ